MNPGDKVLARAAVTAMRDELQAYPKPGLVSPIDSGAHADMDFDLMCRSADSLLQPFTTLAAAGRAGQSFEQALMPIGIEAERGMLAVTGGVNTHRGAIFSVGMIVAAIARAQALSADLSGHHSRSPQEHMGRGPRGTCRTRRRDEPWRAGAPPDRPRRRPPRGRPRLPSVFETGIPAYRSALQAGLDTNAASIQTLFTLMSSIDDTTVLYRGGLEGGSFVRQSAAGFLADGGCHQPGWFEKAEALHRAFIARNLAAGGCADLLACTILVCALLRQNA